MITVNQLTRIYKHGFVLFAMLLITGIQTANSATYTVNALTDNGTGAGTSGDLRYCINQANAAVGPHTINFSVAGTINLTGTLPAFTRAITVAGNTAPGYAANSPVVQLNASGAGWGFIFNAAAGAGSVVSGLVINRAQFVNVEINGVNNITILDCFIGLNAAGTASSGGNPGFGIRIFAGSNCQILNCVIGGNTQHGVFISDNSNDNIIKGCKIGTDKNGSAAVANTFHGILINTSCLRTIIGGTTVAERNVIAGNGQIGIQLWGGSNQAQIINNYIGINAAGTAAIPHSQHGINIENSGSCIITGNVVSGNQLFGILIKNCHNHIIRGNKVGVNAAGTAAIPNVSLSGLSFENSNGNIVGGTAAGEGNIFSGNGDVGIRFEKSSNATVQGNFIGTNHNGTAAIGNAVMGIFATDNCNNHQIGGNTAAARNIISCNGKFGIQYNDACNDVVIEGNYIGTNASGGGDPNVMGNGSNGIIFSNNCLRAKIGGSAAARGNVISGNGRLYPSEPNGSGVFFVAGCTDATFQYNYIGLQSDGLTAMGNAENGLVCFLNCHNPFISDNVISSNGTRLAGVGQGLVIDQSHNAIVIKNKYGTDVSGTVARGNRQSGAIFIFSNNNRIGRAIAGEGNIFCDNGELGIHLVGGTGNIIYNNLIGVSSASAAMGNSSGGIFIHGVGTGTNGSDNIVGGLLALQPNTIAYSKGTGPAQFGNGFGVGVAHNQEGKRNPIIGNKIYCNQGEGIDLDFTGAFGGTSNAPGNNGKSAPSVTASSANTVSGTGVNGDVIHVYRNPTAGSGCGCEGEIYIGTTTVSGGTWSLTHNLNLAAGATNFVSATATDAQNNTSQFACLTIVAPVTWLYFKGEKISEQTVLLEWATSKEENTLHFEVQRSVDGITFEDIGMVSAKGFSATVSEYYFQDLTPGENNYYRIKQVDTDGKYSYSSVITIGNLSVNPVRFYPNPVSDILTIHIAGSGEGHKAEIKLISVSGAELKVVEYAGENSLKIDLSGIAPGTYLIKVITERETYLERLVRQ
ncbi:MAG: right-handed parallel beta-helix repeat-containing protein [Cytophagaceae bacterium]